MAEYFSRVEMDDWRLGFKSKKGGAHGFLGTKVRHGLLAHKEEWSMLQVSGYQAQRTMLCNSAEGNATRIDVQLTVRVGPGEAPSILQAIEDAALTAHHKGGRPAAVKAIHGRQGVETVYIGSRKSDVFIRCYDKGVESKEAEYKDCVRLEVELKGRVSRALWKHCAETGDGVSYLLQVLKHYLEKNGVPTQWCGVPWEPKQPPKAERSSLSRTMSWWARSVAPSVAKASREIGWTMPLLLLMGSTWSEFQKTAILNAASICWGS